MLPMPVIRIVSGGQTGADRGGLEAALYSGIPHGGWCPRGRKAEDGVIPEKYHVREMPSADYLSRTEQNVIDSDATVVFTSGGTASEGSLRTMEFAHARRKPWLHVDAGDGEKAVKAVVDWLEGRGGFDHGEHEARPPKECVLNVAGSRESEANGIEDLVTAIMVGVLNEVNQERRNVAPVR